MDQTKKKISQRVKYWIDDRSSNQIQLTNLLVDQASTENIQRIRNLSPKTLSKTNLLFLAVPGVPPQQNQYQSYSFPGKLVTFYPRCFHPQFNGSSMKTQDLQAYLQTVSMNQSVQDMDQIVKKHGNKVIIVCHSFGSFIATAYCNTYPSKVIGFIGLGGPILRFYPILKSYTKALFSIPQFNRKMALQMVDVAYQLYDNSMSDHQSSQRFKSKEQFLSFTLHNEQQTLNSIFDKVRSLPNILILSIFGDNDKVFTKNLCRQFSAYIAYLKKDKIPPHKQQKLFQYFNKLYNNKYKDHQNLQQKFIYYIDNVGHGIHYSNKNTIDMIQKMIDEYLYVVLNAEQHDIRQNPKPKL